MFGYYTKMCQPDELIQIELNASEPLGFRLSPTVINGMNFVSTGELLDFNNFGHDTKIGSMNSTENSTTLNGLQVANVRTRSQAYKQDLRKGDTIVKIIGYDGTLDYDPVMEYLQGKRMGTVTIVVKRGRHPDPEALQESSRTHLDDTYSTWGSSCAIPCCKSKPNVCCIHGSQPLHSQKVVSSKKLELSQSESAIGWIPSMQKFGHCFQDMNKSASSDLKLIPNPTKEELEIKKDMSQSDHRSWITKAQRRYSNIENMPDMPNFMVKKDSQSDVPECLSSSVCTRRILRVVTQSSLPSSAPVQRQTTVRVIPTPPVRRRVMGNSHGRTSPVWNPPPFLHKSVTVSDIQVGPQIGPGGTDVVVSSSVAACEVNSPPVKGIVDSSPVMRPEGNAGDESGSTVVSQSVAHSECSQQDPPTPMPPVKANVDSCPITRPEEDSPFVSEVPIESGQQNPVASVDSNQNHIEPDAPEQSANTEIEAVPMEPQVEMQSVQRRRAKFAANFCFPTIAQSQTETTVSMRLMPRMEAQVQNFQENGVQSTLVESAMQGQSPYQKGPPILADSRYTAEQSTPDGPMYPSSMRCHREPESGRAVTPSAPADRETFMEPACPVESRYGTVMTPVPGLTEGLPVDKPDAPSCSDSEPSSAASVHMTPPNNAMDTEPIEPMRITPSDGNVLDTLARCEPTPIAPPRMTPPSYAMDAGALHGPTPTEPVCMTLPDNALDTLPRWEYTPTAPLSVTLPDNNLVDIVPRLRSTPTDPVPITPLDSNAVDTVALPAPTPTAPLSMTPLDNGSIHVPRPVSVPTVPPPARPSPSTPIPIPTESPFPGYLRARPESVPPILTSHTTLDNIPLSVSIPCHHRDQPNFINDEIWLLPFPVVSVGGGGSEWQLSSGEGTVQLTPEEAQLLTPVPTDDISSRTADMRKEMSGSAEQKNPVQASQQHFPVEKTAILPENPPRAVVSSSAPSSVSQLQSSVTKNTRPQWAPPSNAIAKVNKETKAGKGIYGFPRRMDLQKDLQMDGGVADKVKACRSIVHELNASSDSSDTPQSRAQRMFTKRKQRAAKYTVSSPDEPEQGRTKTQTQNGIQASTTPKANNVKPVTEAQRLQQVKRNYGDVMNNLAGAEKCQAISDALKSKTTSGRGLEMFMKRRQEANDWVVDEQHQRPTSSQNSSNAPTPTLSDISSASPKVQQEQMNGNMNHARPINTGLPPIPVPLDSVRLIRRESEQNVFASPAPTSICDWMSHDRHERIFSPLPFSNRVRTPSIERVKFSPPRPYTPHVFGNSQPSVPEPPARTQASYHCSSVIPDHPFMQNDMALDADPFSPFDIQNSFPSFPPTPDPSAVPAPILPPRMNSFNTLPRGWTAYSQAYQQRRQY